MALWDKACFINYMACKDFLKHCSYSSILSFYMITWYKLNYAWMFDIASDILISLISLSSYQYIYYPFDTIVSC